jgi:serpin B
MKKQGMKKLQKGVSRYNKYSMTILLVLFAIITFNIYSFNDKETITNASTVYYTGKIYSANASANMVDYIKTNDNIVISPYNINLQLAAIYNGTDNNSSKQIKNYFQNNLDTVNKISKEKTDLIKSTKENETEYDKLYLEYIKEFKQNKYDELDIKTITSLANAEKEKIILLCNKTSLTFERINNQNKLTTSQIKKYTLSEKNKDYNAYNIKGLINNVLDNYESYKIKNEIKSNINFYYDTNKHKQLSNKYTQKIEKDYNIKVESLDYDNINDASKKINGNTKNEVSETSRSIDQKDLKEQDLIITSSFYFNYEWNESFKTKDVVTEEFYGTNGASTVEMMYANESTYLENTNAYGFIKNFENNKYSFIGILPKKENEFTLSSLDIDSLIKNQKSKRIVIGIPKMSYQNRIDVKELLKNYNITDIYNKDANLTKMTNDNIYISQMIQNTKIDISEKGTENTSIEPSSIETIVEDEDLQKVILNRPFVFLIINKETNDVLLIGKVTNIEE